MGAYFPYIVEESCDQTEMALCRAVENTCAIDDLSHFETMFREPAWPAVMMLGARRKPQEGPGEVLVGKHASQEILQGLQRAVIDEAFKTRREIRAWQRGRGEKADGIGREAGKGCGIEERRFDVSVQATDSEGHRHRLTDAQCSGHFKPLLPAVGPERATTVLEA